MWVIVWIIVSFCCSHGCFFWRHHFIFHMLLLGHLIFTSGCSLRWSCGTSVVVLWPMTKRKMLIQWLLVSSQAVFISLIRNMPILINASPSSKTQNSRDCLETIMSGRKQCLRSFLHSETIILSSRAMANWNVSRRGYLLRDIIRSMKLTFPRQKRQFGYTSLFDRCKPREMVCVWSWAPNINA